MAEETNKEILEEIGENVTDGTTDENVTAGTEDGTEGTTAGNGYLTKPYLVRNLQTFWGKIKQYITNSISGFVNQDTVNGAIALAVSDRATTEELTSLETEVNSLAGTVATKASQDALTAVENALKNKVDTKDGMGLSTNDFANYYKDKLDNLKNATETEDGLMSFSDKKKLEGIEVGANKTVVETTIESDTDNPVTCRAIKAALANKVDKEADPSDPSELIRLNNITSYATDEGHIVLNFIRDTEHLRIYTPNSDRPIEKVSLKDQNEVLFTNFQKNDDDTLAITIENPEGKSEGSWNINSNIPFNFYIESLIVDNEKYKPFILQAVRPDEYNLSKVQLSIAKIFES